MTTPVPWPLIVPPHWRGRPLALVYALSAQAARWWKSGLAYQFVAVSRLAPEAAGSLGYAPCPDPLGVPVAMPASERVFK